MNIQLDLFEKNDEKFLKRREIEQKLEILATGKHLRGLRGKKLWEAHERKEQELFGKE